MPATSTPATSTPGAMVETIVERVYRQIRERDQDREPLDQDEGGSPVVVFKRISLDDFDAWIKDDCGDLPRWDYEPDPTAKGDAGRVVVHDALSRTHAELICPFLQQICVTAEGNNLVTTLIPECRRTLAFGRYRYEPNGSLAPAADRSAFPTLVLEVAYSEASEHLRQKLRNYMACPAIQVVIGIKIPNTGDSANQRVFLVQRDASNQVVEQQAEFGPNVQLPAEPLSFPLSKLYRGNMPMALVGQESRPVIIDLSWLGNFVESGR